VPRPHDAIGFARKRPGPLYGVKAVGSFLPGLTRKAFERYGFSAATLITDWATIVGREYAACTAPERLKWPRSLPRSEEEAGEADKGRPGATLLLRVDGGRSLDVQHNARQIVERINGYFGYAAVAELRVVQAPIEGQPPCQAPRSPVRPLTQEVAHIADPGLRHALAKLGAEVKAGR
jgi:hypothetical protein